MLNSLLIENVALIDRAEINFTDGLNVLSGETGSGKSVILEALNFVLGAKPDKTLIKSGENECRVQAVFDVSNNDVNLKAFYETDIDADDEIIISRKFSSDGKSTIKLNGNVVTLSMLKKFTSYLVDVHGQSEHFYLLKNSNQLELLDKFTENAKSIKEEISALLTEYRETLKELDSLGGNESDRLTKIDILNFQINEIDSAELKVGEEDELISIKKALQNQGKIIGALSSVKSSILGDGGAGDILGSADKIMAGIAEFGAEYQNISDRLSALTADLSDLADSVSSVIDGFDFSDVNADEIEERIDLIKTLKRKYGGDIESVLSFSENAKKQLDIYKNFNELSAELLLRKKDLENKIYEKYLHLNKQRKAAALKFSERVKNELAELGMENATFTVSFNPLPNLSDCAFNSVNVDEIEFEFSANAGEPVKPLSSIISGGEISRFMLAVKTQTSKFSNVSTFIFDEIDAGISGNTAKIVAQKFAKIALYTQIIAITHLPQISAMGDNNLLIEKQVFGNKTLTKVKKLNEEEKIDEITRLVGGEKDSASARTLAAELILASKEFKKGL